MLLAILMIIAIVGFFISKRHIKYIFFVPYLIFIGLISIISCFELERLIATVFITISVVIFVLLMSLFLSFAEKAREQKKPFKPKPCGAVAALALSLICFTYAFVFNGIETFSSPSEYFRCYSQSVLSHFILPARIEENSETLTIYSAFECRSDYLMNTSDTLHPTTKTEVFWHDGKLVFNQIGRSPTQDEGIIVTREYRSKRKLAPVISPYL